MDGINGVSTSYSSFVPSHFILKRRYVVDSSSPTASYRWSRVAREICDSLNLCAVHNI
jgi:hypothetical protein